MAEQKEEKQLSEAARKRSPNFPYASLRDCVRYITRLHGEVQQKKVPVFVAFGHMGLSPRSSSTDRIRASLSSYKLTQESVVNKEKHLQLTDLAHQIVIDTREAKRLARYREAALNDSMMRKIWENEWKRGLPNNDAEIVSTLRGDYKFQEEAAKRFTAVLKDNYEFCQLATHYESADTEEDELEYLNPNSSNRVTSNMNDTLSKPQTQEKPKGTTQYPIPLDDGRFAYIYLPSVVTESDAEFIPDFVNLILKKIRRSNKINEQE